MENLKCKVRKKTSNHSARHERSIGMVPGVIYGKHLSNTLFEIGEMELNEIISKHGQHGVINVELDGREHIALIKEVQREPVNHKIIHMDLEEVSANERVMVDVPITFIGEENVIKNHGVIQKERSSVKLQCSAVNVPKHVNLDLSFGEIGDVFRVKDIEFSTEITLMEEYNNVVAIVSDSSKINELNTEVEDNIVKE